MMDTYNLVVILLLWFSAYLLLPKPFWPRSLCRNAGESPDALSSVLALWVEARLDQASCENMTKNSVSDLSMREDLDPRCWTIVGRGMINKSYQSSHIIQLNKTFFSQLSIGQRFVFWLPDDIKEQSAKLKSQKTDVNGVEMWSAEIQGKTAVGRVLITVDDCQIHIVVVTSVGSYFSSVDKSTLQGVFYKSR